MPGQLVGALALVLTLASLPAAAAGASDLGADILACRKISDAGKRLACYDALPDDRPLFEFAGHGSGVTPPFEISGPTRLLYESGDIVMVLYLLDESGAVVRNLHQPGVGAGSFVIEHPGRYHVQVNATGSWQISLSRQ